MKTKIISYSYTGNNHKLATAIAEKLSADHLVLREQKKRSYGTIGLDMLFNRTPKTQTSDLDLSAYDYIILCGPVWMGKVSSPLRGILKKMKVWSGTYSFISISGGADGPNPKLEKELSSRTGSKPETVIDMHIAQLLPQKQAPTREDTSSYMVTDDDIKKLTESVVQRLTITSGLKAKKTQ